MWNGCSFSTQKCFKTFVFVFFFIIHCELYYTNEGFQEVVDNGSKVVGDVKYLVLFFGVLDSGFEDFLLSIRGLLYSSVWCCGYNGVMTFYKCENKWKKLQMML